MSEQHAAASPGCGRKTKTFGLILAAIGFLNFMAFFVVSMSAGGVPDDKLTANGRYFVSEHGKVTEVSERAFRLMRIQERSVWVTHPLAILGMLIFGSASGWKNGISPK